MHAHMLEYLKDFCPIGGKVLDVGSGSGYFSACLARLVGSQGKIIGLEMLQQLIDFSSQNINNDDPNLLKYGTIELIVGDGWKGCPEYAPFDCINVGAAASSIPRRLLLQLKIGGVMLIPVGTESQVLTKIVKKSDGTCTASELLHVRFVPLVKDPKIGTQSAKE